MQLLCQTPIRVHLKCVVSFPKLDACVPHGSTEQMSRRRLQVSLPKRACADWIGQMDPGEPVVVEIPLPKSEEFGPRLMRCRGRVLGWSLEANSTFLIGIDVSQMAIRPANKQVVQ